MADINTITNASNYRGQAAAGGSLGVGVTIDPSPLARLSTFTYYANRDKWEQRQKKDALAAEQIATMAAFDTNSPFQEFTNDLTREAGEIQKQMRDDPSVLTYDRNNPLKYIEFQQKVGKFNIKRKRATVNDTLYNAKKAAIQLIPNQEDREDQLELLDLDAKEFFSGGVEDGYRKQFSTTPELKPENFAIPELKETEEYEIKRNPNDTVISGIKFVDVDNSAAQADALYFGLQRSLDQTTPEFKNLPPEKQRRAVLEDKINTRKRREALDNIAGSLNGLVQSYKKKFNDENLKVDNIPEEELAKEKTIGGIITSAKAYNKQIDEINSATATKENQKGRNYSHINLDDGATPQEIIQLQSFIKKGSLYTELKPTVQQTDNAIQMRGQDLNLLSEREGRSMQFGFGGDENSLLIGNALNDIEIPNNIKPGLYDMTAKGKGNKQNLANIQRLLGSTELTDEDGKIIKTPILSKEDIESNDRANMISYQVEEIDGKPYVTKLKVNNIWYDRGYFRNSQLNLDKEPKGGQKTSYRERQSYLGDIKTVQKAQTKKGKVTVPGL